MVAQEKLVSVIMPVRDAAATVGRAVESIVGQTLADWELIAVDDGSEDATGETLATWSRRDARVRVVRQARLGIVAALERGRAEARGGLIARMDADDVSRPERLATQRERLRAEPELGLVGCAVEFGGDRRVSAGYAAHVDWLNELVEPEQIRLARFVEAPLAHPSVMFRRVCAERWGGYREGDFPEDYELWLRWLDAGVRMAKVPERLFIWSDLPGRLSRVDGRYAPEAFYRVKAQWLARELGRAAAGRAIWVCGAGRPTRLRVKFLSEAGVRLAGFVDVDPRKIGGRVGGLPVVAPETLGGPEGKFMLSYVGSRGARERVRADFEGRGWVEGRDFLLCA